MYDRLKRDGDYLLIYRHDTSNGDLFTSDAEARSVGFDPDTEPKFSALNGLEEFRREDGRFQFKLHYPENNITNIWRQSNNFAAHDVGQFLTRGNLANAQPPVEQVNASGTWNIIEKQNPGSSKWVVERPAQAAGSQYPLGIPQSRLQPNRTYTLSVWCAYENEVDFENASLFHTRWYKTDGSSEIISTAQGRGEVFVSSGNDIVVDGVRWQRRKIEFTTPSDLSTTHTTYWYFGFSSDVNFNPTGTAWYTNFQFTDRPLIKNYAGDYDATSGGVRDYEAIRTDYSGNYWGGIEFNTGSSSLADGSVDHSNWFYSIGSQIFSGGSTPGPGVTVDVTELWIYAPVGIRISDNLLESRHFNEGASNTTRLYTVGVADGSPNSAQCVLNETAIFETENKVTGKMHLITYTADGDLDINNKYILTSSAERTNFLNALNGLTDEYFILVSNGSVFSNAEIDAALARFNPVEWRGASYFSKYSYSYTGVGSAALGMVADRCIFDHIKDGDAEIDANFESRLTIGVTGYGKPLYESSIVPTDERQNLADLNVVAGQKLIYKVRAMKEVGTPNLGCNLRFYNNVNTEVGRQNVSINSAGVANTYEYYVEVPATATEFGIWCNSTDELIDYVLLYRAGFETPDLSQPIQSSLNGLASSHIINSPCAGDPMKGDSWLSAYNSNSNLYAGINMPQFIAGDVEWANQTLTADNQKSVKTTTGTGASMIEMAQVDIDPTRAYFLSLWVNAENHDGGYLHFGTRTKNDSGAWDTLLREDGSLTSTYINIDKVDNPQEHHGKWILLQAFILPHTYTNEQHADFRSKFEHYFGVVNPTDVPNQTESIGIGSYSPSSDKVLRFKPESRTLMIRYRDEGSIAASTTRWALPMITEVKVASFFENTVTAMDLAMK